MRINKASLHLPSALAVIVVAGGIVECLANCRHGMAGVAATGICVIELSFVAIMIGMISVRLGRQTTHGLEAPPPQPSLVERRLAVLLIWPGVVSIAQPVLRQWWGPSP
jgi:hypothetical protein